MAWSVSRDPNTLIPDGVMPGCGMASTRMAIASAWRSIGTTQFVFAHRVLPGYKVAIDRRVPVTQEQTRGQEGQP